ncbi:hypothetical protein DICSQDRAFT_62065 [Dichomitus squalens LYAD-421 SS1]|uniref:Uncharacterized protein n=1 Tax=Dichomitus squalens (strain LYAD-421) TaxID=732165 RepID=R7SYP4_DICSQ|nr:uncharacterized protein DICSQDRAFT_62065 [Dichomitus squalens LYAD-421 SS1]EJF60865.1 hypothetical protein DICSQDRAFT_62065 [Dichomitus squalens LYAD-421 SS1]
MPVTFNVAQHDADSAIIAEGYASPTEKDILKSICHREQWKEVGEILQSSVPKDTLESSVMTPAKNRFVSTVIEAYGKHHHLKIRPDDVWIAILSQLSFSVNRHSEELRNYFVAHEGKKELMVERRGRDVNRYTIDFASIARDMSGEIDKHNRVPPVVDKTLVKWILPDFSTSTWQDVTICSVQLMSTLKSYFSYKARLLCGIPSVTLEGEKADWERLPKRLDRLPELGEEPERWASMLRPILRRFVDALYGRPDATFWEHVVHREIPHLWEHLLSGWITAFCVWDTKGTWLAGPRPDPKGHSAMRAVSTAIGREMTSAGDDSDYVLDGVEYFTLDMDDVAEGYCEVDVLLDDNGEEIKCKMLSGHVAMTISEGQEGSGSYDTLSPAPQWFLYVKQPLELEA